MEKRLLNLTERQIQALKKKAEELGIPVTELVRRILDEYIDSHRKDENS